MIQAMPRRCNQRDEPFGNGSVADQGTSVGVLFTGGSCRSMNSGKAPTCAGGWQCIPQSCREPTLQPQSTFVGSTGRPMPHWRGLAWSRTRDPCQTWCRILYGFCALGISEVGEGARSSISASAQSVHLGTSVCPGNFCRNWCWLSQTNCLAQKRRCRRQSRVARCRKNEASDGPEDRSCGPQYRVRGWPQIVGTNSYICF